ncbi:MAG TPA: S-adenosylmethionine:tRNA ribosyltransferase-isomerase [Chryseolinea sp.]|nr:S-adenosylmethionine:tRNA ribosyltransferase-isomerase [Chryseolinea sp.]
MSVNINDFTYQLPPDRIALYPLGDRDMSKLLVYRSGKIDHKTFKTLPDELPGDTLLFFNNTKVIPARIHFKKESGADIEVFLLEPLDPSPVYAVAMDAKHATRWKCTIGNAKRWKNDGVLIKETQHLVLEARLENREAGVVSFSWNSQDAFATVIGLMGETPLPPYIKRPPELSDRERYQTIYSRHEGAVAAPTAGLHFTNEVLQTLRQNHIEVDYLTLHVSAGTFQPVKVENALEHTMHREQVIVSRQNISNLQRNKFIIAVGTTAMRTLESLYWFGVKLQRDPTSSFVIDQRDAFMTMDALPSAEEAIMLVAQYMKRNNIEVLSGSTAIYIVPGYRFRICRGLITNFHQPGSTLILLVAAFIGGDWKKVYAAALENDYRFLSYGDSSLLLPYTLQ